jgi:hypothetical protein
MQLGDTIIVDAQGFGDRVLDNFYATINIAASRRGKVKPNR